MADIRARVTYGVGETTAALTNTLNDVQSVRVTRGRQWATDTYPVASCTIECRNVAAWTTPPEIGNILKVLTDDLASGGGYNTFLGFISDVQIEYGIVPREDKATIICEGAMSKFSRRQINSQLIFGADTLSQGSAVASVLGLSNNFTRIGTGYSQAIVQTYTGNAADYLNTLCLTEMGYLRDREFGVYPQIHFRSRGSDDTVYFVFSDNPTATDDLRYSEIDFTSAAQQYFTACTIEPLGLASQSAGTGFYGLTQPSYDATVAQAQAHAEYIVNQYSTTGSRPYSISLTFGNQDTSTRQDRFRRACDQQYLGAGSLHKIVFRETEYLVIVEGCEISGDPTDYRLQIYFTPYDNTNYLILNNAVFGVLGSSATVVGNRLGF